MSKRSRVELPLEEQQRRREVMRAALAQVLLEGMHPDAAYYDYVERYSRGELTLDEAIADFREKLSA